jgi:hypothetical protein
MPSMPKLLTFKNIKIYEHKIHSLVHWSQERVLRIFSLPSLSNIMATKPKVQHRYDIEIVPHLFKIHFNVITSLLLSFLNRYFPKIFPYPFT